MEARIPEPATPAAVRLHAERTPNPDSLRFVLSTALVPDGVRAHFDARPAPEVSPLAARLLGLDGVAAVLLTRDFVAVSKRPEADWADLGEPVSDLIRSFVASGGPALGPRYAPGAAEPRPAGEAAARIAAVLDREIRPAVAADGGDVVFAGFEDGVVELILHGACRGCPSSTATLRHGIEARLRTAVPEVISVVARSGADPLRIGPQAREAAAGPPRAGEGNR